MEPKNNGLISVRSYEKLDKNKYYQFFLNVLNIHGYVILELANNILKVMPAKKYKLLLVLF
ncbi:hypothetical protein [Candidatus Regiella insecticola]|uniref:hypothetical protein n=1 Tax=Candidatus Regiella insecticola TaxID=138073 RepID=UPI0030D9DA6F